MQIVIDIPNEFYEDIKMADNESFDGFIEGELVRIIQNGTPLPKGHGRLKDEDEIIRAIEDRVEFLRKNDAIFMRLRKDIDILGCIPKIRCEVSTIIEADTTESEEKG